MTAPTSGVSGDGDRDRGRALADEDRLRFYYDLDIDDNCFGQSSLWVIRDVDRNVKAQAFVLVAAESLLCTAQCLSTKVCEFAAKRRQPFDYFAA
jgi:hypothetical protein